jgi:predicted O-methyltransferase YrrM
LLERHIAALRFGLSARQDARRLRRSRPALVPSPAEWRQLQDALTPAYTKYVTTVSAPGWAVSLETSIFLFHLCRSLQATAALDLGSGFSSYVFRHYARSAPRTVAVTSVDTDAAWLSKTAAFLQGEGCDGAGLTGWDEFRDARPVPHEVVFHDLASGSLREDAMGLAVSCVGPRGVIVFDDAQHDGHRKRMHVEAAKGGLDLYSLRPWTLDQVGIGRWAILGVRSGNRGR